MDIYQKEEPKMYIVVQGIFKGYIFKGHLCFNADIDKERIYDLQSIGRSFPVKNCRIYLNNN